MFLEVHSFARSSHSRSLPISGHFRRERNVVVQFYTWFLNFKFYSPLSLDMLMCNNEFETRENKIVTKDKIERQHPFIIMS